MDGMCVRGGLGSEVWWFVHEEGEGRRGVWCVKVITGFRWPYGLVKILLLEGAYDVLLVADVICFPIHH